MSTKPDGGSAFPQHGWTSDPATLERMKNQGGMSLRDYFAASVAQTYAAMISIPGDALNDSKLWSAKSVAQRAYEVADEMLAERSKA